MEQQVSVLGSVVAVVIFYLTIFISISYGVSKYIQYEIKKRKEKYAISLIENGFKVLSCDSRGTPHLLKKNNVVVNAWYGKKYNG